MTGDEVGIVDEVRRLDRVGSVPQVRDGHRARLLGVVDEVALGVQFGVRTDDLHRGLVRADGAVAAERREDRRPVPCRHTERRVDRQAGVADVVVDADGEPASWRIRSQLVEDRLHHRRGELLRSEAVPTADHTDVVCDRPRRATVTTSWKQRFTDRARFLGPVEHGDRSHARRQRAEEDIDRERTEQAHREHADRLALGDEPADRLARQRRRRTPSTRRPARHPAHPRSRRAS